MAPSRQSSPARRRAVRRALWAAAAVFALALAAAARLALAPVEVGFLLAPRVGDALRARGIDVEAWLGGAEASWDGGSRVRIQVRDFRAARPGGGPEVAATALVDARLRLDLFLRGRPALDGVRVVSPRLSLVRGPDGALGPAGGTGAIRLSSVLPDPGAYRIEFTDARVDAADAAAGARWEARGITGTLGPGTGGWNAVAAGEVSLGGGPPARVDLEAWAAQDLGAWRAEARFQELVPDAFAAALPAAAGLRVPFAGAVRAESGPGGPDGAIEAEGRGGSFAFPHPALDGGLDSVLLERAVFRARLDPVSAAVRIREARVEGSGFSLRAGGGIADFGAGAGKIDVRVEGGVPARNLAGWLRGRLGAEATAWFDESLLAGKVADAEVEVEFPEGWRGPVRVAVDARVEGVEVGWRDGALPLAMDEARVRLDGGRLEVTAPAGTVGPGALAGLRFEAPDVLAADGVGAFAAAVRGDAGELLGVAGVPVGAGGPGLVAGPVEADLVVAIPFEDMDGAEVRVEGAFRKLALRPGFFAGALGGVDVVDLAGTFGYGPEGVAVRADGRTGDGLALSGIEVEASELDGGRARVRGTVAGGARRMLELGETLLGKREAGLPVDPGGVRGRAGTRFVVSAPVAGAGAVEVESVAGTFDGVRLDPGVLAGPFGRIGVSEIAGSLEFRPGWLTVEGTGAFAGNGFAFSWRERPGAGGTGGFAQALAVRGTFDEGARAAAGFAVPGITGPVTVRATLVRGPGAAGWRLGADADFGDSSLEIAPLGWRKAAGKPFAARLSGELDGGPAELALLARGGPARVRGTLRAGGDGSFRGADFESLKFGETRLAGSIDIAADGIAEMVFAGEQIDLREALRMDAAGPAWPVRLELAADDALVGGPAPAGPLSLSLAADRSGVQNVRAFLGLPGRHVASLEARRKGEALVLVAEGSDVGVATRAFGLGESLREGRFRIDATRDEGDPGRPLAGRVSIDGFRLVGAPVLARLLQVATFTGFFESLVAGGGIRFFDFGGDFALRDRVLTVRDGVARGFSLGIRFDGAADLRAGTVDAEGMLIPVHAIGEFFTDLPLIGNILGGVERDGVVAVEFRVRGPADDPEVEAAPLTLLLPGVLRDLFGPLLGGGGLKRDEPG